MNRADVREISRELLATVKKYLKYKELQNYLGLSPPILWRYISNSMKPNKERAEYIVSSLVTRGVLRKIISDHVRIIGKDIVNIYDLVYNKDLAKLIAYEAYYYFRDMDIDAVITVEVDGVPVALSIALILDIDLIIAKKRKELGYDEFYEDTYLSRDPPVLTSIYVPKSLLRKNMRILIADDLLRSGRTLASLARIIREAKAIPVGLFSVVSIGNEWMNVAKKIGLEKIHVMVQIPA
jgi:adenine/guanine phosphoribosyltransferase-like PRPP-binding protein